jgi:hypothetical protein
MDLTLNHSITTLVSSWDPLPFDISNFRFFVGDLVIRQSINSHLDHILIFIETYHIPHIYYTLFRSYIIREC